jgi:S1-C subfamily serine protease
MDGEVGRQRFRLTWVPVLVLAAFVGGAVSGAAVSLLLDKNGSNGGASDAAERRVLVAEESAVSEAVARALPSVVTIVNEQVPRQDSQGRIIESISVGSGFIVDARGFIVTNQHVVENAARLTVILANGQDRQATLVSHDAPFTDVAVIRVSGPALRPIAFGDSASLRLGQTVVAIGSAVFEYRNSVSVGVVSGLGRRWLREGVFMEDLVQTDAAINSGNSGGPLITTNGEVVGMVTNVVRRLGTAENVIGVSFAISSRTMAPIVQSIVTRGVFPRPYFGVDHLDIDEEFAALNNLRVDRGALVRRVIADSPAERAGILAGDVILRLGRIELSEEMPFINALSRFGVNERMAIQVWREGRLSDLTLETTAR